VGGAARVAVGETGLRAGLGSALKKGAALPLAWHARQGGGGVPAVEATASGRVGSVGPRWASAGLLAGPAEMQARPKRGGLDFLFFSKYFQ
jgi:hypothetical protein